MIKLTLDQYLQNHGITRYELAKRTGIQYHIIDKYYKNQVVRYDSYLLNKFCEALSCQIQDLVVYEPDNDNQRP